MKNKISNLTAKLGTACSKISKRSLCIILPSVGAAVILAGTIPAIVNSTIDLNSSTSDSGNGSFNPIDPSEPNTPITPDKPIEPSDPVKPVDPSVPSEPIQKIDNEETIPAEGYDREQGNASSADIRVEYDKTNNRIIIHTIAKYDGSIDNLQKTLLVQKDYWNTWNEHGIIYKSNSFIITNPDWDTFHNKDVKVKIMRKHQGQFLYFYSGIIKLDLNNLK